MTNFEILLVLVTLVGPLVSGITVIMIERNSRARSVQHGENTDRFKHLDGRLEEVNGKVDTVKDQVNVTNNRVAYIEGRIKNGWTSH